MSFFPSALIGIRWVAYGYCSDVFLGGCFILGIILGGRACGTSWSTTPKWTLILDPTVHQSTPEYTGCIGQSWSTPEYARVHWSTLEYTGVHWSTLEYTRVRKSTLECTGVHWSTQEYTRAHWSTLEYPRVHQSTLEYTRVHQSTLESSDVH